MDGTSVHCSNCGNTHTITTFSSINAASQPELKAKVRDGSIFLWECPHCGRRNLLTYKTLYHDPDQKIMIWLTCGDEALQAQVEESWGKIDGLGDYTLRFVDDAGSLIEKVKIFDAGLDDIAVEMCKYVTKMEFCENLQDKEAAAKVKDAPFKLLDVNGADNEMIFSYPADGQMQMVSVGFNVYEDSAAILSRNPAVREKAKGFVKIDETWLNQFFA